MQHAPLPSDGIVIHSRLRAISPVGAQEVTVVLVALNQTKPVPQLCRFTGDLSKIKVTGLHIRDRAQKFKNNVHEKSLNGLNYL